MTQTRTAPFMSLQVKYTYCPVCKNNDFEPVLTAADNTVTKESFTIAECGMCGLRFTINAPTEAAIQKYYQSSAYISHSNTKRGIINLFTIFRTISTILTAHKDQSLAI